MVTRRSLTDSRSRILGLESSETIRQALSAGEQSNANAELDEYAEKR